METLSKLNERKRQLEARSEFLFFVWEMAKHSGDFLAAHRAVEGSRFAKRFPTAAAVLKSAVAAGTTTDATWASDITEYRQLVAEWVHLLSTATCLGMPFRRVPFNSKTVLEDSPGSAAWSAEGENIPMSKFSLDNAQLSMTKIASLIVLSEELFRTWGPASASELNGALLRVVGRQIDRALLQPEFAAVTGKNPSSLTNGATPVPCNGQTEAVITASILQMAQQHDDASVDVSQVELVGHPRSLTFLRTLKTTGGAWAYPNVGPRGGEILGFPIRASIGAISSGSPTERLIVSLHPGGVLLADDGVCVVDASKQAALQMSDSPSTGAQQLVSLFGSGSVGIRVTRFLNFGVAKSGAVQYCRTTF